ncbi:MAG: sigma-54-dependent Fis family transcriptional regulator [Acidobacteria bacterium]|nr:sigma-54-dependent Fis family transcriptional regulator [Acidobacteriota bacterium]
MERLDVPALPVSREALARALPSRAGSPLEVRRRPWEYPGNAPSESRLRHAHASGRGPAAEAEPVLLGASPTTRALAEQIKVIARTDAKVLITGESGVGKEIIARLVHRLSGRSNRPFTPINCAGIPETLLESELFGHVRGSFTGADRDRAGLFESGNGGTLFLDEVGEMSLRMQALLLRFLETGEIQRVGSDRRHIRVDVRLVTATNRDVPALIAQGTFRLDLYYRLNVIHLGVPPLRDRPEDIPVLLRAFLKEMAERERVPVPEVSPEAMALLQSYRWQGNVREVRNFAERLIVRVASGRDITPEDLGSEICRQRTEVGASSAHGAARLTSALLDSILKERQSFWSVVHAPFMARDLTRAEVRGVVAEGLELVRGSYKQLVKLFNMSPHDYKPFLNFLRKHDCHLPFQRFRAASPSAEPALDFDGAGAEEKVSG